MGSVRILEHRQLGATGDGVDSRTETRRGDLLRAVAQRHRSGTVAVDRYSRHRCVQGTIAMHSPPHKRQYFQAQSVTKRQV